LLNNNTVTVETTTKPFFSEEKGRTRISYSISQSSIREFQVNTSNYSAEYGGRWRGNKRSDQVRNEPPPRRSVLVFPE